MKINFKLRLSALAILCMTAVFLIATFLLFQTMQHVNKKQQLAQQIMEDSFQLSLLQSEYVAHPSERPKIQWINIHETQSRLLDEAMPLFQETEEKKILEDTLRTSEYGQILFRQLVHTIKNNGGDVVKEELYNQLTMQSQESISHMLNVSALNRANAADAERSFQYIVGILALSIALLSLWLYGTSNTLARSLRTLEKGTQKIADGDYAFRLPIESTNELGTLSRAFNDMAKRVKESQKVLEQRVKERTSDLERTNDFLDTIIENIPNMIFLKDAKDLRFVRFNKAGEELLGYSRKDLVGKSDYDFFPKEQADFFMQKDRDVLAGGKLVDIPEEKIQTKLLGERWLHTMKIPICDSQGVPLYLLGISEDITDRKFSDRMKSEFVSLASHQLRTPLTEIRWGLSSLVREASLKKDHQEILGTALKAAVSMSETIRSMLTISHIESDEMHTRKSQVNLKTLLADALSMLQSVRDQHDIALTIGCPDTLCVYSDEQLLKEILTNLISNACKYTPKGGSVTITAIKDDANVKIIVQDVGYGIPAAEHSRVSEKFFRGSNIVSKHESGNGLGLYLVYALSKILGGSISFVSEVGKGTTFTLVLPA